MPTRRTLIAAASLLVAPLPLRAQGPAPGSTDPRMSERAEGKPDAKVAVQEWFSLTCVHCARFAAEVYPKVRSDLIDTGKIRYIFKDYPLDATALMAAQVARALPPERYEPFILTLFATQSRWAFDRSADPKEELAKMAALAGMPRNTFDATVNDEAYKNAILAEQQRGEAVYHINSTPTFVFNERPHAGEMSFDEFKSMVGV